MERIGLDKFTQLLRVGKNNTNADRKKKHLKNIKISDNLHKRNNNKKMNTDES